MSAPAPGRSPATGSGPSPTGAGPSAPLGSVLGARQAALAAEHAAVFGYAALGPGLGPADAVRARSDERVHRSERDRLRSAVLATGARPVASLADYPLPETLDSALAARRLALQLETACERAWRFLLAVAASDTGPDAVRGDAVRGDAVRADAVRALTAAAVRGMLWRRQIDPAAPTEAFPGI